MEIHEILKLLTRLTEQTSVKDAVITLSELVAESFSNVSLVVYDLHSIRVDESKVQKVVCINTLDHDEFIYLNDDSALLDAYENSCAVKQQIEGAKTKLIFPVVLYDKTISHFIIFEHEYPDGQYASLIPELLKICTNVFRSLHEKGYDPLTRILNRQAFDQVTSDIRYNENPSPDSGTEKQFKAIAILDIDKFKAINDNYGHAIGDETLVLFAQAIRSVLRQEDLFFRYGGEEFVVLIKEKSDSEQAHTALERCRHAIEEKRFPQVGSVTVSIGYADLNPEAHFADVLSKADKALYYIKNNGRNNVESYEELLGKNLLEEVKDIEGSADFWD